MRTSIFQAAVQLGLLFFVVFIHGCSQKPSPPPIHIRTTEPYVLPANWETKELVRIYLESKALIVRQNICRQLAEKKDFPIEFLLRMMHEVKLEHDRALVRIVMMRDDISESQIIDLQKKLEQPEPSPVREKAEDSFFKYV